MKTGKQYAVVLVTTPDVKTARRLARLALEAHLVACGNLIPKIESHYWWRGKIENSSEVLILFKTTAGRLQALETLMRANHPYDTPEIIALSLSAGTERYLAWMGQSVGR